MRSPCERSPRLSPSGASRRARRARASRGASPPTPGTAGTPQGESSPGSCSAPESRKSTSNPDWSGKWPQRTHPRSSYPSRSRRTSCARRRTTPPSRRSRRAPRRSSRTSRTRCSPRSPRPSRLASRGGASAVDAGVSVHRWQSDDLNANQKLPIVQLEQCLICISRCRGIVKWLFWTGSACPQRGDEVSCSMCVAKRGCGPHLHGASWLLSGQTKILNRHRRTLSPGRMSCARSFFVAADTSQMKGRCQR
nr:MAG TPA: hypothetical protein [Caudoviricetes sp.]